MAQKSTSLERDATEREHPTGRQESNERSRSGSETKPIHFSPAKRKYKSIPEDWKALPQGKFLQVISHLEAVLLEISVDGKASRDRGDLQLSTATLQRWADHLRKALKQLTS